MTKTSPPCCPRLSHETPTPSTHRVVVLFNSGGRREFVGCKEHADRFYSWALNSTKVASGSRTPLN